MSHIQLRELCKFYTIGSGKNARLLPVLNKIELDIEHGEFISLVGPSGCGKSTLLRILSGITRPDSGTVNVDTHSDDKVELTTGYILQNPALLPWYSVQHNIVLPAQLRGQDRKQYSERVYHLLELVGLEEFAEAYPYQLSRGMAQKVALCRGLLLRPSVLLMDEPFSSVDTLNREQLDEILEKVWLDQSITTLFVTHSIDEAVLLSDRVAVLSSRPASIIGIVSINLTRPRTRQMLNSVVFAEYVREVRQLIHSQEALPLNPSDIGERQ